jgi:hypothetical protein
MVVVPSGSASRTCTLVWEICSAESVGEVDTIGLYLGGFVGVRLSRCTALGDGKSLDLPHARIPVRRVSGYRISPEFMGPFLRGLLSHHGASFV